MSSVVDLTEKRLSRRDGQTYRICYGGRVPADAADNTSFHQSLLDDMTGEARLCGWEGAAFADYACRSGYVSIAVVTGSGWPTLEDLRVFRDLQRQTAAAAGRDQPEQGSMFS